MVGPSPHLIVGLGNPGPEYERTRHNCGSRVAETLAARFRVRLRLSKLRAMVADVREDALRVLVAKPATYMNESGQAVGALVRFFRIPPELVVVVHDDLDIPLGEVRVKSGGGTAGHNGLESIVAALHTKDFARVRIGIGRPPAGRDPVDWVLGAFGKREEEAIGPAIEIAADAALEIVREGAAAAQNRFNAPRA
ncbi:MAG: aminoacyl-tRNA hydrolase [Acidobacteria bacterium]|nr:aminoacyl-tRNA hydrolase [Acidobacteriota bacterium]